VSVWSVLLTTAVGICAVSAVLAVVNLLFYRRPRTGEGAAGIDDRRAGAAPEAERTAARLPLVSICIPARNEAENIEACVRGALAQRDVAVEVLVYDDDSTDGTGEIVTRLAADPRVRAVAAPTLPEGWNGKQHACQRLGEAARGEWLLFTDADVRFEPGAAAAALSEAHRLRADLVSTFPRQITGSLLERLVIPLMHFILLSYLPFPFMRRSRAPGASAGCGQFLFVRRAAWERAGGHAAFRDSMHDGIRLPRRVRETGGRSDLFDGTDLVSCRMYRDFGSCWRGFAKNAYEGLGSFVVLCVFTVLHLVGHVLPWVWLVIALATDEWRTRETMLALTAIGFALAERALLAWRFRQSFLGVALHPLGILLMTAIQWHSFVLAKTGRRTWRGRTASVAPHRGRTASEGAAAAPMDQG